MKYNQTKVDVVLFDLYLVIGAWAYVHAILYNFDAVRLGIIGGTIFFGIWGNLKQNGSKPPSTS